MKKRYPFKFLDAYVREDAPFYFGRDEDIDKLYEMVFQTDLLLIYGASGTGKTSLIKCGLANKFFVHDWLSLFVRRGSNINHSLEKVLIEAGSQLVDTKTDLAWLDQDLSPLAKQFNDIHLKYFRPIYLIFDQFEELYILGDQKEQYKFFETIKEILRLDQPIKIIISIREEYLGYLYNFEQKVPDLLRKKLRVEPMTLNKVTSVIKGVGNSAESNVSFAAGEEDEIAKQIFEKIRENDRKINIELPYLQVFLDKLYLNITHDKTRETEALFSLSELNKIGNIGDVLRDFLDEVVLQIANDYKKIDDKITDDKIWKILSSFVTSDGTKEPIPEKTLIKKFPDIGVTLLNDMLQTFVKKRILRFVEDDELYEISHDALAKQIHAKRSDEEITLLEVQRIIRSQIALKDENREYFTEKQLSFIEPFLEQYQPNEKEMEWIDKSRKKVKWERRKKQMIWIGVFVAIAGVLFLLIRTNQSLEKSNNTLESTIKQLEIRNKELNETLQQLDSAKIERDKQLALSQRSQLDRVKTEIKIQLDDISNLLKYKSGTEKQLDTIKKLMTANEINRDTMITIIKTKALDEKTKNHVLDNLKDDLK
jgi:hypothetical protein